jgi:hypothetical protein
VYKRGTVIRLTFSYFFIVSVQNIFCFLHLLHSFSTIPLNHHHVFTSSFQNPNQRNPTKVLQVVLLQALIESNSLIEIVLSAINALLPSTLQMKGSLSWVLLNTHKSQMNSKDEGGIDWMIWSVMLTEASHWNSLPMHWWYWGEQETTLP